MRRKAFPWLLGTVGLGLSRTAWVKLKRLSMHKWGLAPSPNCECGVAEYTADHVLIACPMHQVPYAARDLTVLDDETRW